MYDAEHTIYYISVAINSNNNDYGLTNVQHFLIKGNRLKVNGYQNQTKLMQIA